MSINRTNIQWTHLPCRECDGHGSDPEEWSDDLRIREFPEVVI